MLYNQVSILSLIWRMVLLVQLCAIEQDSPFGEIDDLECRLLDVSSLVNAKLTFSIKCIQNGGVVDDEEDSFHDYIQDFLQKLSCATELTIGSWFIEVPCMLLFKGLPIPEFKCKYLTLELHMEKFNLYGVAGFLRASHHVETLNVDMADILCDNLYCNFEEDNIDLPSWISSIAFPNLKNVKIANSLRVCLKEDFRWGVKVNLRSSFDKLAEVLLKNATVLEKFVSYQREVIVRMFKSIHLIRSKPPFFLPATAYKGL
ncbi:hypothetical protein RND71_016046 [Anisodus tanguticus]|uniref:FBD domain-containing protein n=1 Tax=Anisodus tanguticus TaxID=243964 RepID=A0AAE1VCC7_9SOLA|nr:hypothetical protein RND71_016046 [Anisodus tanguticus]